MDDLLRLAERLTEAHRRALGAYTPRVIYGPCCPSGVSPATKRYFSKIGLLIKVEWRRESQSSWFKLSPIGEALRARASIGKGE